MNFRPAKLLFLLSFLSCFLCAGAITVSGVVLDGGDNPVPFSSIYIKGSSKGTTANEAGHFMLELEPGTYTLFCTHVGFNKQEKNITIGNKGLVIAFRLLPIKIEMRDVIVKARSEDPALVIIRKTIKTRSEHLKELKEYQVNVYIKGLMRSVAIPKSIMGIKVNPDRNVIDSSGKGIIYFSESLTKYSRRLPRNFKEEIISAKVSGRSQAFGFNSPHTMELNLYENNLELENLNSRGFVSPIADNALNFYNYRFEGTFYEDGLEINRIRISPKRKYEPCFAAGYINIIEGSWRLHGLDLYLTKESQIEIFDSLHIEQQMLPVNNKVWVPQQTTLFASLGILGFKATANFTSVYSDYNLSPSFNKNFFGNVIRIADTSSSKSSLSYWETIRPVPLTNEETGDYIRKDSLEKKYKDPRYLDSLDRRRNKIKPFSLILKGYSKIRRSKKMTYTFPPLIEAISYNTVQGAVFNLAPRITHYADTGNYTIIPNISYGFSDKKFQASASVAKTFGKKYNRRFTVTLSGGKSMVQINGDNPVTVFANTVSTLLYTNNAIKLYQKSFGAIRIARRFDNGFRASFGVNFEKRHLPENADTTYLWHHVGEKRFTNNYPEEFPNGYFPDHRALVTALRVSYQPFQKYIQYPNRKISVGSVWPTFTLNYTHGWKGLLGSDVNYDKWRLGVTDAINLKLGGNFNYRVNIGGFVNTKSAFLPDAIHFIGNQSLLAGPYLQAFQLAPYYKYSNFDNFYTSLNIEHHFNGSILNKVPVLKKLNLGLVAGVNGFYVDENQHYTEVFFGLENILKILRADFIWGYRDGAAKSSYGVRLGFGGIFSNDSIE